MIDLIQELLDDERFLVRFCENCSYATKCGYPGYACPTDGCPAEPECLRHERFRRVEDAVEDVYSVIREAVA